MIGSGRGSDDNTERGIVYRALEALFDSTNLDVEIRSTFKLSMIDIYNDSIKDLFQPHEMEPSSLSQSRVEPVLDKRGFVLENLTFCSITSMVEAINALDHGFKIRRLGAFDESDKASRSHLIIVVKVN